MAKITVHISQSADPDAVNSFISALLVLILKVNGNDIKAFQVDFKTWVARSEGLLRQLGIKKEFTKIANTLQVKGTFSEEDAASLGKLLKANRSLLEADTSVTHAQLGLFKDCAASLHTDSQPAWKRIEKNVSILRNPKLNTVFLPSSEDEVASVSLVGVTKKLKDLSAKLVGRPDHPFLNPRQLADLRKTPANIEALLEYGACAREINKVVKAETFNFVRNSGKETVDLTELKDYLNKKKIINNLPTGFIGGKIDEQGKMYTKEGRQLDKVPFGVVVMNPKYHPSTDNTYVMSNIDIPSMRYRTLTFLGSNKDQRHAKVSEFFKTESTSRKKWLTDLIKANSKEQVFAAMVELLYSTSCRIGGKGNATKGEPTYGLTTLQVRHLTFTPAAVEFNYSGKKSAEQHHLFKTTTPEGKKIRAVLLSLVKSKDDTDLVFTFKGKPVLRTAVNSYLRSLGLEITAHKFRQLAGTKVAIGVLRQAPFKKSGHPKQAAVDKWVKEELKKVGEVLHHRTGTNVTGQTAVKSYIDPVILKDFYGDLGLRIPSWVPASTGAKGSKTEDSDED